MVTVLETMSSLVKRRDQALGVDISNDTADGVLSGGIRNSELLSKIGKDGPKQPKDVSNDNEDAILVSKIGYDWGIGIKLGDPRRSHRSSRLANIIGVKEKLRR
ncbi:MAG: hypothetical protein Q9192_004916 [Flavoplaca navasiana]